MDLRNLQQHTDFRCEFDLPKICNLLEVDSPTFNPEFLVDQKNEENGTQFVKKDEFYDWFQESHDFKILTK